MADEKCILDPQRDCLGIQKANMLEKQMSEWNFEVAGTDRLFDAFRKAAEEVRPYIIFNNSDASADREEGDAERQYPAQQKARGRVSQDLTVSTPHD